MQYFSGMFDAEGCVSICPSGACRISVEITNEDIANMFHQVFGGNIYKRKREKRRESWQWVINSRHEEAMNFAKNIIPYSVVKRKQLQLFQDYLENTRDIRKQIRTQFSKNIKLLKDPNYVHEVQSITESIFSFEWLAGFLDGDGNIVCYEYIDNRSGKKYFSRQISISNIFKNGIDHINDKINGTIIKRNKPVNPIYTWVCNRENEKLLCDNIQSFLKIKSKQLYLFQEFIKYAHKKYGVDYPTHEKLRMYDIINEIKHLNSK